MVDGQLVPRYFIIIDGLTCAIFDAVFNYYLARSTGIGMRSYDSWISTGLISPLSGMTNRSLELSMFIFLSFP